MKLVMEILFYLCWPFLFVIGLVTYPFKDRCQVCRKGRLICHGEWGGVEFLQCDHCYVRSERRYS